MWLPVVFLSIVFQLAQSQFHENNAYGPDYGKEWMFYTDEDGTPHYVNLTADAADERRIFSKIHFYLYTRQNSDEPESLEPEDKRPMISEYFNPNNELKVLTHGWLSSGETEWILNMKDAYLAKEDYNVIIVSWHDISRNPVYPIAAYRTRYVGRQVAKLLDQLDDSYGYKGERTHLTGHSLGAHVMGFAGQYSRLRIFRITGLDPARPHFEFPMDRGPNNELDSTDADFVDIIHTCAGVLGYKNSHGHVDFYPNGGSPPQPGCEGLQHIVESCSHGRSEEYFIESIYSSIGFYAYPCVSWQEFEDGECQVDPTLVGDPTDISRRGDFYLYVNSESPYARGRTTSREAETKSDSGTENHYSHIDGTDSETDR